jgi:hypothetical protein
MTKENLIWIGLTMGCVVGLWSAISFRKIQEEYFNETNMENLSHKKKAQVLKNSENFMKLHEKEINYLTEKSWFSPENRLNAGEFLSHLTPLLKSFSYQFDPEIIKTFRSNLAFRVTQINFEAEADTDLDLYKFIDELMKEFPGIILPRELTLTRHKDKPGVKAKFVVDWVAMKDDLHEE